MKWEFRYHGDQNYLEVIITGPLSSDELNKMAIERWKMLQELNCRKILFDFTGITNMLATVAIYHRPTETENVGVPKQNRSAAVVPKAYWNDFKFMETVYRKQGYDLTIFDSKEEAVDYLVNSPDGEKK